MGEVVEDVRGVPQSSKEHQRWASAAPVEHLQTDTSGDRDEGRCVPREIDESG
jgi:hypothetical protein